LKGRPRGGLMVDEQEIETDALFSRPVRTLFGKAFRHSWFKHVPKLTYAVLVGRNVTTDTQLLDAIIDTNGRLLVSPPQTSGIASSALAYSGLLDSIIPGNVASAVSLISDVGQVFELGLIGIAYECDATVATRTVGFSTQLVAAAGAGSVTPSATFAGALTFYSSPTISLTASEDGYVLLVPENIEITNDNGTIARATNGFPIGEGRVLPPGGINVTPVATNGVAGDNYRIFAWGRRVG